MKKDTKRVGIPTGIIKQHAEKMYKCSTFFKEKNDLQFDLLFVNSWPWLFFIRIRMINQFLAHQNEVRRSLCYS